VSSSFARVFGAQEGTVYACPDCETLENIKQGAATDPETTCLGSELARPVSESRPDSEARDHAEAPKESDESATVSNEDDQDGCPSLDLDSSSIGGCLSADTRSSMTSVQGIERNSESDEAAFEALLG